MAEKRKPIDPLAAASQAAHERALRDIERDPVLADKMEDLKAAGGADPFHYDLWRRRTAPKGPVPEALPQERPRGGTHPNLPKAAEPVTLVDVAPPEMVAPPSAVDTSRTDETVVVPRVPPARPKPPVVVVAAIALAMIGVGVVVLVTSGGERVETAPTSSAPAAQPSPTSAGSPRVTVDPPAPVPSLPAPSAPAPSTPLSAEPPPRPAPVRSAVPNASHTKTPTPPTSATPIAPPAGSHKSSVPEKPIF